MATSPYRDPAGDDLIALEREPHASGMIIRVVGDIDLCSYLQLRNELLTALGAIEPHGTVVLDLTKVDFIASVGLTELLMCQQLAITEEVTLRVVASDRRILRPLEITGVDRMLDLYPNVDDALRAAEFAV